jgi:hypothetical protein
VGTAYLEFLGAESAEAQLQLLERLMQAGQAAPAPSGGSEETQDTTPPVDPNNPRSEPLGFTGNEDQPFKTMEQAWAVIDRAPWPFRG